MLANLKIICRFHAHPVHQNSVDIFGPRFLGSKLVSFNQTLVPDEISKVNFQCSERRFLVSMSEEI